MNSKFPHQKSLFSLVEKQFSRKSKAIEAYEKQFPTSTSNARARFNAEISITFDHGIEVAKHFGLRDFEIFPDISTQIQNEFSLSSSQADVDAYFDTLIKHLNEVRLLNSKCKIHFAISEFPIFLVDVSLFPELNGFLMFFCLLFEESGFSNLKFGRNFLLNPSVIQWQKKSMEILKNYHSLESYEYWSPYMLNYIFNYIFLCKRMNLFAESSLLDILIRQVNGLIEILEKKSINRKKLFFSNNIGADVKIYNHEGLIKYNNVIFYSDDMKMSYEDMGFPNLYKHQSLLVENHLRRVTEIGTIGGEIRNISPTNNDFFVRMKKSCDDQLQALKY